MLVPIQNRCNMTYMHYDAMHYEIVNCIPSFELDFTAGLFEGVIPGTAGGGRQRKKFGWNETFDVEDRLLVLLRCMHRIGFGTIGDLLAALFVTELCSSWKGRIAERLHFSSDRFSIHGREFTSGALRSPPEFRSSIAADK